MGMMLDTFNSNLFGVVNLTTALNKIPYQPNWLGQQNLFQVRGIPSKTAVIEERHGVLSLVPTSARGTTTTTENRENRVGRSFLIPHLALTEGIYAEDVQDVRAFGSETALQTMSSLVNDRMVALRANIEVTKEYHRIGAIHGKVLDADGASVIIDLFTVFGITETSVVFAFGTAGTDIKQIINDIQRRTDDSLGGTGRTGLVALCGDTWFDALINHPTVVDAYNRWQGGQDGGHLFRTQQIGGAGFTLAPDGQSGFRYAGCDFFNYRGKVGSVDFVDTSQARFFPTGVPQLFQQINAPADYEETVNTMGLDFYAKQERMKFDKGRELEVQTNPFILCTRPDCLTEGTLT